jgi:hypothetical protein
MRLQRAELAVLLMGALLGAARGTARGQQLPPSVRTLAASRTAPPAAAHRFWDRTNLELFGGVAAVRALDFTSTRHFRARGVNEALLSNAVVDNQPAFAAVEAAATAASIGLSYWLHRTGHHRLERWVSIVHIGAAGFGDARNYTLGNSAPRTSPP